jgi:hypothetical protein
MNRLALLLCALLVGVALNGTSASAHGRHHHGGWHHGGLFGGWNRGLRHHTAGDPIRVGPHCWVDTDSARGFGFYKWCDGARPAYRGHHRHHRHHH